MQNHQENNMVNAIVRIANKKVSFVNLELVQEYGQHHHFKIQLDYDAIGKPFMNEPTEQIDLIGRMVIIDIQHGNNNGSAYVFKGIITKVRMTGKDGKKGYWILEGSSPTVMLERGKRMDVYSDTTLHNIFKKLIDGVYSDYIKYVDEPTFENKIDFLMQYNETDWEFLKRISYLYGENLFYSGSEIIFGAYEEWETIKLTYDKEIADIEFCTKMLPNQSVAYQYISEQDSFLEKQSPDKIENSNPYLDKSEEQNSVLTSGKPAKNIIGANVSGRTELDELVKREKSRTAAQTIYIKGSSKTYESTIGRLITIQMPESYSKKKELGTYRIVKSIHRINERLIYTNEFEAVPASLITMPVTKPPMPIAESILGKVSSHEDPQGQGRIQVDFAFANQYSRIWMRVMTPNAGSSDVVGQNRGMVFIPEKGDQVMVGFEYGDPNRPYVMGSMFHGKNGIGGKTDNHIKSIITRNGHTIQFDDAEESLSITIKDKNGNIILLDSKGKNIEITAPETILLKATDIKLEAANNIEMEAQAAIKADAMDIIHIGAQGNLDIVTESDIQIKAVANTSLIAQSEMKIEGQSVKIASQSDAEIVGVDTYVKGQSTQISGAGHKIEIM